MMNMLMNMIWMCVMLLFMAVIAMAIYCVLQKKDNKYRYYEFCDKIDEQQCQIEELKMRLYRLEEEYWIHMKKYH